MSELRTLSYGEQINYTGIINGPGIYKLIKKWISEHDYNHVELMNEEHVYDDGRQILLELRPYKELSEYAKVEIKIDLLFKKLEHVTITRNDVKHKTQKGELEISFSTYIITDLEGQWTAKPLYFFLRTIIEKFVYRSYIGKYEDVVVSDKNDLMREIRSYLNMERFK